MVKRELNMGPSKCKYQLSIWQEQLEQKSLQNAQLAMSPVD